MKRHSIILMSVRFKLAMTCLVLQIRSKHENVFKLSASADLGNVFVYMIIRSNLDELHDLIYLGTRCAISFEK